MSTRTTFAATQPEPSREGATPSRDETTITRVRSFSPSMKLMHIILQLRREHVTGSLILDLNQGGICNIRCCESSRIDLP